MSNRLSLFDLEDKGKEYRLIKNQALENRKSKKSSHLLKNPDFFNPPFLFAFVLFLSSNLTLLFKSVVFCWFLLFSELECRSSLSFFLDSVLSVGRYEKGVMI